MQGRVWWNILNDSNTAPLDVLYSLNLISFPDYIMYKMCEVFFPQASLFAHYQSIHTELFLKDSI